MGLVLTIAGTPREAYLKEQEGNPSIEANLNARAVLRATLVDGQGSYRPAKFQDIVATLDGTRIFGGIIQSVNEREAIDGRGRVMQISATDYNVVPDNRPFNGIAGTNGSTLKDVVTALMVRLSSAGITLDPGMGDGAIIGAQGFPWMSVTACFNQLKKITGWLQRIDYFKVLRWYQPGTVPAPFALTRANVLDNSTTWDDNIGQYMNEVWLLFGDTQQHEVTRTMHGDGSTHLFPLTGQIFGRGYTLVTPPPTVTVNGVVFPVGTWGVDPPGLHWYYRASDPIWPWSLIHELSDPTLGPGDTIVATFTAQFPGVVLIDDAGEQALHDEYGIVESASDILDVDLAIQYARGILRNRKATPKIITTTTRDPGLEPGMSVSVDLPQVGLLGDFLVQSVTSSRVTAGDGSGTNEVWKFTISAVEGNEYRDTWLDYFRGLDGGGGSAGGTGVFSPGGSVAPTLVLAGANWGGSRQVGITDTTAWTDIPEYRDVVLSTDARVILSVEVRTRSSSVSVQPRVMDLTAGSPPAGGIGSVSTSTNWVYQVLSFNGLAGHRYRLQAQPGANSAEGVYVVGVGA